MDARLRAVLASVTVVMVLAFPVAADEAHADLCLELTDGAVSEAEWTATTEQVVVAVESRSALFPEPTDMADPLRRFDVWSGREGVVAGTGASCLEPGFDWTTRLGRDFLEAGADQMLAEAPTTPGIESSVTIEWYPDESRLRTTLVFAGPFDIPNGTCWVDDALSVDTTGGTVVASGEQGVKTSPFAEGACRRFFEHLPDGGAGEQAVTLLPPAVELGDGGMLRFVAGDVMVRGDAIIVSGSLERD